MEDRISSIDDSNQCLLSYSTYHSFTGILCVMESTTKRSDKNTWMAFPGRYPGVELQKNGSRLQDAGN